MRRFLLIVLVLATATGCMSGRALRALPDPRYYEAYYDGHYGPFIDGYWSRDERSFWYLAANKVWRRDTGHHFIRGEPGPHYTWVRGSGAPRTR